MLNQFNAELQNEIRDMLKAYDRVYIVNGKVTTCLVIDGTGGLEAEILASDVYTPAERNANYKETFGYNRYPQYK